MDASSIFYINLIQMANELHVKLYLNLRQSVPLTIWINTRTKHAYDTILIINISCHNKAMQSVPAFTFLVFSHKRMPEAARLDFFDFL